MREWIYGRNPVFETLKSKRRTLFQLVIAQGVKKNPRLNEIIGLARKLNIEVNQAPRYKLDEFNRNNQGVALEASGYSYAALDQIMTAARDKNEPPFILILDALQDPQNLGTLLRTAEIVGVHGVIIPKKNTALVNPTVVSSSSGASEHLLISQMNLAQTIKELKQENVWVYGLEGGEGSQTIEKTNLKGSVALVVGNEGQGMRRLVRESCDGLIRLPMRGKIESLNAATAGSIALYFTWQAREFSGS